MPIASIVIATYNHLYDLTIPCLDRIVRSTVYPHELILVDDGGSDHSMQYFQTVTNKSYRLSHQSGPAAAKNVGIEHADGDPIVLLDNDVLVSPYWLTILVNETQKPGVGIVAAIYSNEIDRLKSAPAPDGLIDFLHVPGGCTAITRACHENVGFFDEGLAYAGEDTDLCYRALERGWRVCSTPRLVVEHKAGGTRRDVDRETMKRSAVKFREKYHNQNALPMPPLYPFG